MTSVRKVKEKKPKVVYTYFRMINCIQVRNIFKLIEPITNEDFVERVQFIMNCMSWKSYEIKDYEIDFLAFNKEFKPDWITLYEKYKNTDEAKRSKIDPLEL